MIPYRFAVAAILAGLLLAGLWWHFRPHPAPVSVPVVAQPSKAVSGVGTETIKTPLRVFKAESKNRLNLPKSIQQDPAEHVAAASTVKPDTHPHTVSTLVNDKTGDVTTYDTREPLPWLTTDYHGEAGIAYGIRDGQPTVRLEVRQNILDVKALKLGVQASADQPVSGSISPSYFVGVGVSYRW